LLQLLLHLLLLLQLLLQLQLKRLALLLLLNVVGLLKAGKRWEKLLQPLLPMLLLVATL
jgi:hypothetical protein